MAASVCDDGEAVALAPLRWNLVKIERAWEEKIGQLETKASEETCRLETEHREQRRTLAKDLRRTNEEAKAIIPLNGRLQTMRASRDNLARLGRKEESENVHRKLAPLEKTFFAKALAEAGITEGAKRDRDKLLGLQQTELAALSRALRRHVTSMRRTDGARQARDAEIKAQRRSNVCSRDDIWTIWFAAKSGETWRLSKLLAQPNVNVDQRDPDTGYTALHFASRQGKLGAVEALLAYKAFVGKAGPDGRTPLHLAAGWGTYEVCLALLQAGADKDVLDRDGLKSSNLASSKQRHKIAAVLERWRPIGLTFTQTQSIISSQADETPRPWEIESDPTIRGQLRALHMKRAAFGERHPGLAITLGKLAGLYRLAGRLEDSRQHLEQLLDLLRGSSPTNAAEPPNPPRTRHDQFASTTGEIPTVSQSTNGASFATAQGNLGVVCHELGEADRASELLEAALEMASAFPVDGVGAKHQHIRDAVTRNLGLHYLSEGRVDEARLLLRECLKTCGDILRPDMPGGDESLALIEPLTLSSYADMLAGDDDAAANGALRAQFIADKRRKHSSGIDPTSSNEIVIQDEKELRRANPIPRLEWIGVQLFVAERYAESAEFFARARSLVVGEADRPQVRDSKKRTTIESTNERNDRRRVDDGKAAGTCCPDYHSDGTGQNIEERGRGTAESHFRKLEAGAGRTTRAGDMKFDDEAMRLDRCAAVAVCRLGPESF